MRLLLAEDSKHHRNYLAKVLRHYGLDISGSSGAKKKLAASHFLLDSACVLGLFAMIGLH